MKTLKRLLIIGFASGAVAACGSDGPTTPVGDAVNGVWTGSANGSAFVADIHSLGESGIILGTGSVTAGGSTRALNIEGAYVSFDAVSISLHFVATNYEVYFDGRVTGSTMPGTLQGSKAGFNNVPVTLQRK